MIEKEYKNLLSKSQYDGLNKRFRFEEIFTQVNFYYSGKEEFDLKTTIRVRSKREKMYLQVKESISRDKGIHIKKEYEQELSYLPYVIKSNILNELCQSNNYRDSFLVGVLITERKSANLKDCQISIDINHYCGITDYEVEVEYHNEIIPEILDVLKSEKIYKNENTKGKYERFIGQYLKGKRENARENMF